MNKKASKIVLAVFVIATLVSVSGVHAQSIPSQIAALQDQVKALQTTVTALQTQVGTLQTQLAAVRSNHALLLDPFVRVDSDPKNGVRGPHITFSGANIHIVSGMGATDDNGTLSGLGNLIIGYDENPPASAIANPQYRSGSHNLIVGRANQFPNFGFGNLIAGENNYANGECGFIAGANNTIYQLNASVCGGQYNTVGGNFNVIVGGSYNAINQTGDVLVGGYACGEIGT